MSKSASSIAAPALPALGAMTHAWREWLVSSALPLWSEAGFDKERCLYHERLSWDACPNEMPALRLMVQARQIATYCRAALDGLGDRASQALQCLDMIERLYCESDGAAGWVFSIAPNGDAADRTRDLYAHAFVLFAYGWAYRLTGETRYRQIARRTADQIDKIFKATNAGFLDAWPTVNTARNQNPHMHLFEAYLVLLEATGDDYYFVRLQRLTSLLTDYLIEPSSGLLLEVFDPSWEPAEPPGCNRVEPGHLFEWSWLLMEYQRIASLGISQSARLQTIADHFFRIGFSRGYDPVRCCAIDAIGEYGNAVDLRSRIWPQTELLRLLAQRRGANNSISSQLAELGLKFLERYAPGRLKGGWIDRLDEADKPLVDYMPASSFYHIYGAGRELVLGTENKLTVGSLLSPPEGRTSKHTSR